jgi:hypothetical protein
MTWKEKNTSLDLDNWGGTTVNTAINHGIRRYDRITVDTKAFISTPMMGESTLNASLIQLGKGGGLLSSPSFLGVGRIITVDLGIHKRPVRAIAKVLYEYRNLTGDVHAGFSIEYMDGKHGFRMHEFIDSVLEESQMATA